MPITVTEILDGTRNITYSGPVATGSRAFNIEGSSDEDACLGALMVAIPPGSPWAATGQLSRMFPAEYYVEKVRCGFCIGRTTFSNRTSNSIEYSYSPQMVTLESNVDIHGDPLPDTEQISMVFPGIGFNITRTEPESAWGKGGMGNPSPSFIVAMQRRVLYLTGRLNSNFFMGCDSNTWLFLGASCIVQADGTHRVTYEFLWKQEGFGTLRKRQWQYRDRTGVLHDIYFGGNLALLQLVWPQGGTL